MRWQKKDQKLNYIAKGKHSGGANTRPSRPEAITAISFQPWDIKVNIPKRKIILAAARLSSEVDNFLHTSICRATLFSVSHAPLLIHAIAEKRSKAQSQHQRKTQWRRKYEAQPAGGGYQLSAFGDQLSAVGHQSEHSEAQHYTRCSQTFEVFEDFGSR